LIVGRKHRQVFFLPGIIARQDIFIEDVDIKIVTKSGKIGRVQQTMQLFLKKHYIHI